MFHKSKTYSKAIPLAINVTGGGGMVLLKYFWQDLMY
jgi:hypothetical protein